MIIRPAMLFLAALVLLTTPSGAAEQRTYQDRLRVRAIDTVELGQLVDGRVSFHEAEDEDLGNTVYILVEGSAHLEGGESIEAAEKRAVLDALTKVFQRNKEKSAHLVQSTSVHNYEVVDDTIQIEFDYVLQPGLTILDRTIGQDSVVVTLRVPIQTPVWGGESKPSSDFWVDAYGHTNSGVRTLLKYRSETARSMSLWMNRIGGAVRDLIP
ncbi:MAG: hypothetical protein HY788_09440 [Deltaproteobacteria bacterium]|nr:hypothetical protein [Deltaproteobacteria bacterium]